MEKFELIEERSFGDKFNELTGFIYDNFKILCKWAFLFVLPVAFAMSAIIEYMPDYPEIKWLKLMLCILLFSVLAIVFTTVMKHHFLDPVELRKFPIKKYAAEILRNIGVGMFSIFIFEAVLSFLAFESLAIIENVGSNFFSYIFCYLFYFVIVAVLSLPIFHTINAVVIEHKSGLEAMSRAFSILTYRPYMTVLFLGTMTLIGYILPFVSLIPFYIISQVDDLLSPVSTGSSVDGKQIAEFVFQTLCMFCYSLQMLAITVGMMFDFGNAVEKVDNVSFMKKFNDFDNL